MAMTEVVIGGMKFVKAKSVTRPVLKIEKNGKPVYFRIDSTIRVAEKMEKGREKLDANGIPVPPPHIMDVTNLETGEENTVVCNSVLQSELESNYADGDYVGRCFSVEKFAPAGDKRYATFSIAELALEGDGVEAQPAPSKKRK